MMRSIRYAAGYLDMPVGTFVFACVWCATALWVVYLGLTGAFAR